MARVVSAEARGQVWAAKLFLLSLVVPFGISIGPVLLSPHRLLILVLFVPFFFMLFFARRAGPVLLADWLIFGSALWVALALAMNHPVGRIIEPAGIHMIEFFGAYLIARVAIQSSEDFHQVVKVFFIIVMVLLPFAAIESLTHRPILLELLPGTYVYPIDAGARLGMRRAQSLFAHPIIYGVFVSAGLGFFWYTLKPRGLRFAAAPLVAMATIFSLSTGALISFIMQAAFISWDSIMKALKRRWTLFVILAILGYILIDLLSNRTPFHVLVTYATFSTGSAYNRILIWQYGTENVWANPIFGIGLNDWARPVWMVSSVDNYWLLIAMMYGLPAIVMLLLALVLILRKVALADLRSLDARQCRAAYLVVFGGLFIAGGTVHFWHAMMAFVMFIYGSGGWIAAGRGRDDDDGEEAKAPTPEEPRRSRYTRQSGIGTPIGADRVAPAAATRAPLRRASRTSR